MDKEIVLNIDGSHNGHNYVDLGLSSGTMWATCNVGADKSEDDGLLFQFGRVDGYKYDDENNKFTTTYENITGSIYINKTTSRKEYNTGEILSLDDDAANINMGGDWIMLTKEDLKELYNNTNKKVVHINSKRGMLFTSKINGKSLFVPFVGAWYIDDNKFYNKNKCSYLWTSEVDSTDCALAWAFCIYFDTCNFIDYCVRANGYSIRGILK